MRRRLLAVYLVMLALVLVAVAVPYAAATAARDTQEAFIDQLNDTARFASLAEPALRTGETVTLQAELARYDELFGVGAAVVDINGEPLVVSRDGLPLDDTAVRRRMEAGLSGERSGVEQALRPWRDEPMVLAEPVGRGGEVTGAVLTVAPTDQLRGQILRRWGALAALAGTALTLAVLAGLALARWTLRPVRDLDAVAHRITAGALEARVPEDAGPAELRRLATSFNLMADTVTGALTRQRAFVSQASHQLRTPLGVLRLRVENLAGHLRPSGDREHRRTLAETLRLAGILDSMLALARAEGAPPVAGTADAGMLMRDRAAAWGPVAGNREMRLEVSAVGSAPVRATVETLEQCLDALIDNALKFGPRGGRVLLRLSLREGWTELHVIDEGPGLEEAERVRATEPFWRGQSHQNVPGSGLGLSVVAQLVAACDGELALLPARPGGVDARLRLRPAEQQSA
ncbi:HAMP domain-containing sensor histidine kinase [Streptomyces sodiiphilus]|uniref:histidine kinase n=1 Tax=Streptomyces sodiiphilus TaxID=226217 RepID=A0ABN2NQF8_9ACTN